jgi:hypothetical protein
VDELDPREKLPLESPRLAIVDEMDRTDMPRLDRLDMMDTSPLENTSNRINPHHEDDMDMLDRVGETPTMAMSEENRMDVLDREQMASPKAATNSRDPEDKPEWMKPSNFNWAEEDDPTAREEFPSNVTFPVSDIWYRSQEKGDSTKATKEDLIRKLFSGEAREARGENLDKHNAEMEQNKHSAEKEQNKHNAAKEQNKHNAATEQNTETKEQNRSSPTGNTRQDLIRRLLAKKNLESCSGNMNISPRSKSEYYKVEEKSTTKNSTMVKMDERSSAGAKEDVARKNYL